MPKAPKARKVVHPNSRAAGHLSRKHSHVQKVERHQADKASKLGSLGEKLLWFHQNLDSEAAVYSKDEARQLIECYLNRFEDELEQISIKQSIGSHRSQQHIARQQNIMLTMKDERETYNWPGFEIPDITTVKNLTNFMNWSQELRYIPNIKLIHLKAEKLSNAETTEQGRRSRKTSSSGDTEPTPSSNPQRQPAAMTKNALSE